MRGQPPNRDTPPDTEMEAKRKIYQRMYLEEQKYWKDNEEIIKKQMDEDREKQLKECVPARSALSSHRH